MRCRSLGNGFTPYARREIARHMAKREEELRATMARHPKRGEDPAKREARIQRKLAKIRQWVEANPPKPPLLPAVSPAAIRLHNALQRRSNCSGGINEVIDELRNVPRRYSNEDVIYVLQGVKRFCLAEPDPWL